MRYPVITLRSCITVPSSTTGSMIVCICKVNLTAPFTPLHLPHHPASHSPSPSSLSPSLSPPFPSPCPPSPSPSPSPYHPHNLSYWSKPMQMSSGHGSQGTPLSPARGSSRFSKAELLLSKSAVGREAARTEPARRAEKTK